MRLRHLTDWVVVFLSGTILLALLYGGWCDLIDGKLYKPVIEFGTRFSGPTHHVIKSTYKPGEMVMARVIIQKQRNLMGNIQWQLVDHKIIQYAPRPGSLPMGIYDGVVPIERLPENIEPGEYWFAGTVTYPVNWLSNVSYSLWTEKFKVVKP